MHAPVHRSDFVNFHLSGFVEVPSPPVTIVTMEERHTYMCSHSQTDRVSWRVNGSVFGVEIFPLNVATDIISFPEGRMYTLTIGGLLEHNETNIECAAALDDGSGLDVTPTVTFLMQGRFQIIMCVYLILSTAGLLQSVSSLVRNASTLSWVPPFSLDLTSVEPDVVYCVEVYNITCGRSHLISECDVMDTSYTNDVLHLGYIYEYTVTPRSNVQGVANGTSQNAVSYTHLTLPTILRV